MNSELSPRQVAVDLRLSESTVRLWLARDPPQGAWRTPGGHWRLTPAARDELARRQRASAWANFTAQNGGPLVTTPAARQKETESVLVKTTDSPPV